MTMLTLDSLDLAALVASRVCHDVINPVSAIINGLEVLDENVDDPEMRQHALELVRSSAQSASAKLQFCRLAFGASGSIGAVIDTGDAERVARNLFENERTKMEWDAPRILLAKNKVKVILNLCLIANACIYRGGTVAVKIAGEDADFTYSVEARGTNAKLPSAIPGLLEGTPENGLVDGNSIQPFYTGVVARACQLTLNVSVEADLVAFSGGTSQLIEKSDAEAA